MFRLRTAFATVALVVGLGSTSQAQVLNQGFGVGLGVGGFPGGFQQGFGGFQQGVGGFQQFGVGGLYQPFGTGVSPFYGSGYGVPYYQPYGYYPPPPQTYNAMGSLIDSIQSSTSRRASWRLRP